MKRLRGFIQTLCALFPASRWECTRSQARPPRMEEMSKVQEQFSPPRWECRTPLSSSTGPTGNTRLHSQRDAGNETNETRNTPCLRASVVSNAFSLVPSVPAGNADLPHQVALGQPETPVCIPSETLGTSLSAPRIRWERVGQVLLLSLTMLGSSGALAKFEFNGFNAASIDIPQSNDPIPYTFTVTYRPFEGDTWNGNNQFANYRIGLSDMNAGYDPVRLTYTELEKSFKWSSIKVRPSVGTPTQAPINSKGWTHGQGSGFNPGSGTAQYITATFEVSLLPAGLKALFNAGQSLEFCVHGEENSDTTFFEDPYNEQCMMIGLNYPANVKVSGLRDMPITGDNPGIGGYYQSQMDFCVFVSRDPRNYRIGFLGGNGNDFLLKNSSNAELPYIVQFADDIASLDSADEHTSKFIVPNKTNGSTSIDCNSHTANNAAVRVKVNKTQADNVGDGAYTDTVTVLVQAT